MSDLNQRIKETIQAIGATSPSAPDLLQGKVEVRQARVSRPLVAAVAGFAAVAALFVLVGLFRGSNPSVLTGEIEVVHQVFTHRIEFDLPCEGGAPSESGGFNEMTIESWADVAGMRFRQQVVYPDGSTVDTINLGHPSFPRESWTRGESKTNIVECVGAAATGPLSLDPAMGIGVMMFDGPIRGPGEQGYQELGTKQPGEHTDSMGRPVDLYLDDWGQGSWSIGIVDNETGVLLEVGSANQIEGIADVRAITTLITTDTVSVTSDHFDTTGYTLQWTEQDYAEGGIVEGVEIEPPTLLGPEWIWPEQPEAGGQVAVAERFAIEVLGWTESEIEGQPDATPMRSRPAWMLIKSADRSLPVFFSFGADGWGLYQISEGGGGLAIGAEATPMAGLIQVAEAVRGVALVGLESSTRAWEADLTVESRQLSMPGVAYDEIRTLMVLYYDQDGEVLTATGGHFYP